MVNSKELIYLSLLYTISKFKLKEPRKSTYLINYKINLKIEIFKRAKKNKLSEL
jgi:hypothetical protein